MPSTPGTLYIPALHVDIYVTFTVHAQRQNSPNTTMHTTVIPRTELVREHLNTRQRLTTSSTLLAADRLGVESESDPLSCNSNNPSLSVHTDHSRNRGIGSGSQSVRTSELSGDDDDSSDPPCSAADRRATVRLAR